MKKDVAELLSNQFFELVPFNVSVIDREHNIIAANKNFEEYFGSWKNKKCYEVYKKLESKCKHCNIEEVFDKGVTRVSNESGLDKNSKQCHYVVHTAPLKEKDGTINYIVEMSTDLTEVNRYQQEYNLLFEKVPSYVSIIDKNFKIIRANKRLRETFGDVHGKYCYEVYKKRKRRCKHCPAARTFKDGNDHVSPEIGLTFAGDETKYIVTTTPLSKDDDGVKLVIEIATDITEINDLQDKLRKSHDFYANLIENAEDGVIAIDERGKTIIFNTAAKKVLNWTSFKKPVLNQIKKIFPKEFFGKPNDKGVVFENVETYLKTLDDEDVPVRLTVIELMSRNDNLGRVAFFQDLRKFRELEKQKLDAERLGAVGETVAGLAHTIKNVLMGLEGGMYIVDTGLRKGDANRIIEGWSILQRNFTKTTDLVKGFLSFAKGKVPELIKTDPNELVKNIVSLYFEAARAQNVFLTAELSKKIKPVMLDPEGIEACLTNLVSNAIDAAMMKEDKNGLVTMKTKIENDCLVFEVIDNGCGMDSEVIQNIFTTFFTTKGNKGTGLGLLTTNKIVKEHGGSLQVESDLGVGSIFRIVLPLDRLNKIANEYKKNSKNY